MDTPFAEDHPQRPGKHSAALAPEHEAMNTFPQINLPVPHDEVEATPRSTLQCSEAEPAVTIETCLELDRALHQAELNCNAEHPIIVCLHAHGHRLGMGLGLPDSFVSIQCDQPATGPSLITLDEAHQAQRRAVFFFPGGRRAEISSRNLVPAAKAREVFREFFATGARSTSVNWQAL